MSLSEEARDRLEELVELAPTKNSELQDRWDLESGSEVHRYLEAELRDYYFRDEDSLIRPTVEGARAVGAGLDPVFAGRTIELTPVQADAYEALPGPDEAGASVVSVLHALEDAGHTDLDGDAVRSTLRELERTGLVATEKRAVTTFKQAVAPGTVDVETA